MKLEFKPEDFQRQTKDGDISFSDYDACIIAGVANARLREMLAEAPVLFGKASQDGIGFDWSIGLSVEDYKEKNKTHHARLVEIEELK